MSCPFHRRPYDGGSDVVRCCWCPHWRARSRRRRREASRPPTSHLPAPARRRRRMHRRHCRPSPSRPPPSTIVLTRVPRATCRPCVNAVSGKKSSTFAICNRHTQAIPGVTSDVQGGGEDVKIKVSRRRESTLHGREAWCRDHHRRRAGLRTNRTTEHRSDNIDSVKGDQRRCLVPVRGRRTCRRRRHHHEARHEQSRRLR